MDESPSHFSGNMNQNDVIIIKSCYSHIGGKFGNILTERFIDLGWIKRSSETRDFTVTKKGKKEFTKLGFDFSQLPKK
jgi:hypothetical protein